MNTLEISLFGRFKVVHGSRLREPKLPHTTKALLAYLLLERFRAHSRDKLIDLFWGERSESRARSCLSTALWRLRSTLESDAVPRGTYILTRHSGEVSFNWESPYWLDAEILEKEVGRILSTSIESMHAGDAEKLRNAINLHSGDLLEGFYDDWLLRERERFRRLYLSGLAHLMQYYKYHGTYNEALKCGQRILKDDPLRESVHREMISLYLECGRPAMAARQYQACRKVLEDELNISPMEETQALYTQIAIKSDQFGMPTATAGDQADLQQVLDQLYQLSYEIKGMQNKLYHALQLVEKLSKHYDQ